MLCYGGWYARERGSATILERTSGMAGTDDELHIFRFRVREQAEEKGWTVTELARRANITRETARRYWENETKRPTAALLKLADALQCTLADLVVIEDPRTVAPPSAASPR